jgi:hypothetical protein
MMTTLFADGGAFSAFAFFTLLFIMAAGMLLFVALRIQTNQAVQQDQAPPPKRARRERMPTWMWQIVRRKARQSFRAGENAEKRRRRKRGRG